MKALRKVRPLGRELARVVAKVPEGEDPEADPARVLADAAAILASVEDEAEIIDEDAKGAWSLPDPHTGEDVTMADMVAAAKRLPEPHRAAARAILEALDGLHGEILAELASEAFAEELAEFQKARRAVIEAAAEVWRNLGRHPAVREALHRRLEEARQEPMNLPAR